MAPAWHCPGYLPRSSRTISSRMGRCEFRKSYSLTSARVKSESCSVRCPQRMTATSWECAEDSARYSILFPLLQPRYAKPASDLGHLGLCERLTLFNSLLDRAQHNFLEKFDVVRIDNFLIDLDCNDIARAVRCNLYLPATGAHFDSLFLKLSLRLAHLLLHLLSLFH